MEQLWSDVKYAARLLARSPGFTAVAIVSLALGVGANTTIFSLLNAFLLQPLPGREPARLATVYTSDYSGPRYSASAYPDYLDFRSRSPAFEGLAAFGIKPLLFTQGSESQRILAQLVSGNFFEVLGLPRRLRPHDPPGRGDGRPASGRSPERLLLAQPLRGGPGRGRPHGRPQRKALHGRRHRPRRLHGPRPRHRRRPLRPDRDGPVAHGETRSTREATAACC